MENLSIRIQVKESGITYREIAAEMGITHSYLSRLMRTELSAKNKLRMLDAINRLIMSGKENNCIPFM